MESADIYVLARLRWQFFGSLPFRTERLPERIRMSMCFALVRKVVKDFRLYFPNLPWCLRLERGEIGGRIHNHFLLGGCPKTHPAPRRVRDDADLGETAWWTSLNQSFRSTRLSGVDYVAECLGYDGADSYESAKFGTNGRELHYSHAVWNENHFRRRLDR